VSGDDERAYAEINRAKAKFDDIYTKPDPFAYFKILGDLDYQITGQARPVFQKLINTLRTRRKERLKILDLGCSYGINAALLKYQLGLDELYAHWCSDSYAARDEAGRRAADRAFFAACDADPDLRMVGHDTSVEAIDFALDVGLLEAGFSENLEEADPGADFAREIGDTDLVITTGAIGYVGEETFRRLAERFATRKPWICSFVLRMFAVEPIRECLAEHGYVTEKLEGRLYRQRRFKDEAERTNVAEQLRDWGLDPSPETEDGFFHAECFLSRPKEEADIPAGTLLAKL